MMIYAALAGADAAVLMTEWNAYRGMDLDRIKKTMRGNIFIDLRNVYEPELMRAAGFDYVLCGALETDFVSSVTFND